MSVWQSTLRTNWVLWTGPTLMLLSYTQDLQFRSRTWHSHLSVAILYTSARASLRRLTPPSAARVIPGEQFPTYNDCDEDYMQRYLTRNYPPGFLPFFMSKNQTNATSIPMTVENNADPMYYMFNGYLGNICPLPCTQTYTTGSLMYTGKVNMNETTIELLLPKTLMLTKTYFPQFSMVEVLTCLGGSMGLWLGLGVLQLIERLLSTICHK